MYHCEGETNLWPSMQSNSIALAWVHTQGKVKADSPECNVFKMLEELGPSSEGLPHLPLCSGR